ncbi:MAG: beta-propeller fold lactonase family protein, partial [Saprospiraceae bacterium]|nr:beta-propeller fold lactonase family protein [Saprospiraceae bacterium]
MQKSLSLLLIAAVLLTYQNCKPAQNTAQNATYKTHPAYTELSKKRLKLPNQWSLTPAGRSLPLGDLPLQMAVSPSGKYVAVTNNGVSRQHIQLIDIQQEKQAADVTVAKAWYGLAWSADGKQLWASGGNDNTLIAFQQAASGDELLKRDTSIKLGEPWAKNKICPAGVVVVGNKILTVTKEDSTLYVCDAVSLKIEKKTPLSSEPFAVIYNAALNEIYVSLWGAKQIWVFNSQNFEKKAEIKVGDHPNEMILNKNGKTLFVANALDNSVSVVDLAARKELEVLNAALYPNAPNGSTTNSLALSDDEKSLFVANADNNCLAVFDVSKLGSSRSKGFIPTGWYPTSVRVVGSKILVANGKGMGSAANPDGPSPLKKRDDNRAAQYIGHLFKGSLSIIDIPDEKTLAAYSLLVYENTPYSKEKELVTEGEAGNPIPMKVGAPSPIKYVFYIVKENRTYDQLFGDVKEGNGDPNLCLFPEKVTPNQHKIVRDYVLLDNFYVDAEVSADGHNWSMAAYANDFVEKTWPTSYGGRGGNYDYEGTRRVAFPKSGFIWDMCRKANVSYRTYGEFADDFKASYPTLEGHFCPYYSSWDMNYQDIKREKDWERDFDSLLAINQVPRFNTIRFGNDHTSGMSKGAFSPNAAVADNDLAVGRLVEHLSNTSIWKESVVFILEDDAQNGADHVDAHRSTAYVISPYVKKKTVDHTMYSTSSMLRTMELILGLPPMSQYDAAATPMWRCFTSKPDFTSFKAVAAQVDIDERNLADNELSRRSQYFNLAQLDAVPEREFNEVLWKAIKGEKSEMPAPRRGAWLLLSSKKTTTITTTKINSVEAFLTPLL